MFSLMPMYCRACGKQIMVSTNSPYRGEVCNRACSRKLNWMQTLSTLGKDYRDEPPVRCSYGTNAHTSSAVQCELASITDVNDAEPACEGHAAGRLPGQAMGGFASLYMKEAK